MSFDQIVRIVIKPGTGAEFEAAFSALGDKVRATEPDTLVYRLYRVKDSEAEYRAIESYASEEAARLHMKHPELRDEMRVLGAFMAGPPSFEFLVEC
jgi:quinol monooxygenase YgiN